MMEALCTVASEHSGLMLTLAQAGGYGPWGMIIGVLRGLLIAAGGLGFVVGIAIKGVAGGNADRQELGNKIIEGSIAGLVFGLLGESIYNHIVEWTT